MILRLSGFFFFFFNDTATTEIYTLSLHDALPICELLGAGDVVARADAGGAGWDSLHVPRNGSDRRPHARRQHRSEEHTSELQSQSNLVCRLLLEKKKQNAVLQSGPMHQQANATRG